MMLVRDIMTVGVVHLEPGSSVDEARALFLDRKISGAPVMLDGTLLGIVTKTDLIRHDTSPDRGRIEEVMTTDVITLSERMSVSEAARLMMHHDIRRAPVLRDGRVVGIVSRSDLLRPYARTDSEIQADIEQGVLVGALGISPRLLHTRVLDSVVFLEGSIRDERMHAILRRLVAAVPGVTDIIDHLQVSPMPAGWDQQPTEATPAHNAPRAG